MAILFSGLVPAQIMGNEVVREDRIKAAIVYKLGKFVDWPADAFASPDAPLEVCLLGEDPFATALSSVAGRMVQGRRVAFRILSPGLMPGSGDCHILFFPRSTVPRSTALLRDLAGRPVLTISDLPGFAQLGGMIALVRSGNRLSFEIDPRAAREAGLVVRAQLLDLAQIVEP